MRLNKKDIQSIVRVAKEIYEKRGGDIDLLVRTTSEKKGVLARIRMIARLKQLFGDQKIDVIGDHEESLVAKEALITGIRLI